MFSFSSKMILSKYKTTNHLTLKECIKNTREKKFNFTAKNMILDKFGVSARSSYVLKPHLSKFNKHMNHPKMPLKCRF